MRLSFLKNTQGNSVQKVVTPPLSNKNISDMKGNLFSNEVSIDKCSSKQKQSSSIDVSFNLDKMYFESDTSAEQSLKKKICSENKQIIAKDCTNNKQMIDEVIVNGIEQQHQQKDQNNELQMPQIINNLVNIQREQQILCEQQQSFGQPGIKQQHIQEENQQKPQQSNRNVNEVYQEKFHDQQIQVDFPQNEDSQNSAQQLSQIDILFISPQNITKYNQQHLLNVGITDLAKIYPLNLSIKNFVILDPVCHSENNKKLFDAFMIDWGKSQERLSKKVLTLAKMRTIIIRDAMNNLVDQLVPPVETEDYHFRISKTYRNRYLKAGVPIPPPRVNNSYLERLFFQPQIKRYYQNYVMQRLELFLKDQNYRKIEIYTLDLIQFLRLHQDKTVQQIVQILQKKKKPFTNKQIELIIEEATKIGNQYGKDIKRIGNGVRSTKMPQQSRKMLQKINNQSHFRSHCQTRKDTSNQVYEEEQDSNNQQIEQNSKKKVKLEEVKIEESTPGQEVKTEVKIQQQVPKNKRKQKDILLETRKVKKQKIKFFDPQDQLKQQ